jgi:Lrp/AsnC family transcriptional regulator, regulator for asnA, asnC and gidA
VAGQSISLDAVDRKMIALLQKDGRITTQALARAVGVSDVTARRKLRRLLGEGVVQIVAGVDPFQIGYESPVIIGLKVDRAQVDEIAEKLCRHPSIRYVAAATGNSDLIIEVVAASNHELAEFLLGHLSTIPGIYETETSLVLRIYKQSWDWGVRGLDGDGGGRRHAAAAKPVDESPKRGRTRQTRRA